MHGNQWVLKIAVLKYYSVSKRGTTAKSNPKQATDPISLHTKFGDNSSNTFPLNERKPCVTPDIGRRTPDIGHRTTDIGHRTAKKAKIIYPPPRGVDIILSVAHNIWVLLRERSRNMVKMHYSKNISTEKSKPWQTLDPCNVLISRLFASYISRIALCTTRSHIIWSSQTQRKSTFVGEFMRNPAENVP